MFRILDNTTGLWIKNVPWGGPRNGTQLTDRFLADPGRVFKRRGDLSNHIANNLDFYTTNAHRLDVVEYEFAEVEREPIHTALKAKQEREKKKAIEQKKAETLSKLREIERLRAQIDKLSGKT